MATFCVQAITSWMPQYLRQQQQQVHDGQHTGVCGTLMDYCYKLYYNCCCSSVW
jgi:hypothetical protein